MKKLLLILSVLVIFSCLFALTVSAEKEITGVTNTYYVVASQDSGARKLLFSVRFMLPHQIQPILRVTGLLNSRTVPTLSLFLLKPLLNPLAITQVFYSAHQSQ